MSGIGHSFARSSDGTRGAQTVALIPRSEKVVRGKRRGELFPEELVTVRPGVLVERFQVACREGRFPAGPKLRAAAWAIVQAAGRRERDPARAVAVRVGVSARTVWRAVQALEAAGLYVVERFERAGEAIAATVRSRRVEFQPFPANRFVCRVAAWVLSYPRSKGGAPACGRGAEPVEKRSTYVPTPEEGPASDGFERASKDRDAVPGASEVARLARELAARCASPGRAWLYRRKGQHESGSDVG